jgi:GNAT superfamily N-acetyltransferase
LNLELTLVDWDDPDALRLRTAQQAELLALYGEEDIGHEMTGASIVAMVLVRADGEAVACGAISDLGDGVGELKRMFVDPAHRGRGLSRAVVRELERVAQERGFRRLVLETGVLQASAIGLYLSEGYRSIPNFGEYATEAGSRCFAKDLGPTAQREPRTGERPTVTLTHADWTDPVATALRLAMWHDIEVRYPEIVASVPGGFDVDDPQQGVGALSTVIAWLDGRPVGCSTLRAAREGYPPGSGELKKVWVDDDARALGLTSVVLQTGIRQPEAVTLYLSAGYRPVVPFFPYDGDFLSLWMAKDL